MQPGLTIVSNRLPVSVKKIDGKLEFHQSVGGLSMGLASYATNKRNKWIGWPGLASDDLTEDEQQQIATELQKSNCYPVFLTQKQLDGFYNGYSNRLLWPLFHDVPLSKSALKLEADYWKVYRQVNNVYADAVLALSLPQSNIWVHDYQLLLLPELLRAERPADQIGFFLHIPFPAPKDFDKLHHAKTLLRGMLGADLVGFHIVPYAQNFLDSCKQHDVGVVEPHKILLGTRVVRVTDFPIGIDYAKWRKANKLWAVRKNYAQLKVKYWRQKIILTVDRLDPTKGFIERVTAYRTLLEENPAMRGKVKLVMIAVPSRSDIPEYVRLREKVETMIDEINRRFGTSKWLPVEYNYKSLDFEHLRALYQRADIAFITPLRDGMNLVAKEYIASKPHNHGVLVLSQTAGAAQELKDAIMVNPRQPASVVDGLKRAVLMPRRRFRVRLGRMQQVIAESTIQTWAKGFMQSLRENTGPAAPYTASLNRQRQSHFVTSYRSAGKRLLLLDYDGVLAPFAAHPEDAKPSKRLLNTLEKLSADKANTVVIISGRAKPALQAWFGELPINLVAEHGFFTRPAGKKQWQSTTSEAASGWQTAVLPILEKYTALTPGSSIETKEVDLVWHYRKANPYYAQKYLVVLKRLLRPFGKRYGLQVSQGNKILEVRPISINKGTSAVSWLEKVEPGFTLAIGDDYTDEDMFTALPVDTLSIKVGRGRTAARYRLKGTVEVIDFLQRLAK